MSDRIQFFHSHNHQAKPRVRRLADRLEAVEVQMVAGPRLWWDEWGIPKSDIHRSHTGRWFIPLFLGVCLFPDTLWHCKVVDFPEESEASPCGSH